MFPTLSVKYGVRAIDLRVFRKEAVSEVAFLAALVEWLLRGFESHHVCMRYVL